MRRELGSLRRRRLVRIGLASAEEISGEPAAKPCDGVTSGASALLWPRFLTRTLSHIKKNVMDFYGSSNTSTIPGGLPSEESLRLMVRRLTCTSSTSLLPRMEAG
ncbi:hypothetical protein FOCC_FOCC013079 [Frankliniella occidentalis]|nr:hypothetical protein FOCC_FOCC013079 [Frankliniella occidentalis]